MLMILMTQYAADKLGIDDLVDVRDETVEGGTENKQIKKRPEAVPEPRRRKTKYHE